MTSNDVRVSLSMEDAKHESDALRTGRSKYNHYMEQQIDLILDTDWSAAFSTKPASFGKVVASFVIRKDLGTMRSIS